MATSLSLKMSRLREMLQLHKHFHTYFKVVPAVTPELVREAQRIRHSVYCEELGWEPVNDEGLERDSYDENALHCLLMAVRSQRYIGCVRLVLPQLDHPDHFFPIQESCRDTLYAGYPDLEASQRGETAEVSRLAIVADYRRRKSELNKPVSIDLQEDATIQGRRRFPYIPVGLYIGMLEMASFYGIKTMYMLTEPLLATHFSRLGGNLKPIGDAIEHRGRRRPYVMEVEEVLKGANLLLRPLIWTIRRDVNSVLSDSLCPWELEEQFKKKWRQREAT